MRRSERGSRRLSNGRLLDVIDDRVTFATRHGRHTLLLSMVCEVGDGSPVRALAGMRAFGAVFRSSASVTPCGSGQRRMYDGCTLALIVLRVVTPTNLRLRG